MRGKREEMIFESRKNKMRRKEIRYVRTREKSSGTAG